MTEPMWVRDALGTWVFDDGAAPVMCNNCGTLRAQFTVSRGVGWSLLFACPVHLGAQVTRAVEDSPRVIVSRYDRAHSSAAWSTPDGHP